MVTFWRFLAITLSGLALTMTSAHVLELPQKMNYSPEMYSAVNSTLYRYFAIVGGAYQIGGIVSAIVLTVLMRRRASFRVTLWATALLLLAFVSWLVLVQPVNQQAQAATRESLPSLWVALRTRWEYGHVTGFALQLAGFCVLVFSAVRDAEGLSRR